MPTKNLENLEKKGSDTNQKLKDLKFDIFGNSKDRKRFETLSKDSTLKKGIEKIYEKSCNDVFSKERKHFEKLHIGGTLKKMLQKYPNLRLEITGKLGLSLKERKFSNLTLGQKLKFTALYQSVNGNSFFDKKNPTSDDIAKRINRNIFDNIKKINRNFTLKNVGNFLKLEKTLKEDFKLTQSEALKVKEYLEIIKKHPEFIGINKPIEAASGWGYGIALVIGLILGAVGMHYIDNIGKIDPESKTRIEGVTTIEEPEAVLKLITSETNFSVNGRKELKPSAEGVFFDILNSNFVTRNLLLDPYMDAQTKEILMNLKGRAAMQFDLRKGSRIDIVAKDGKGEVYVQLPYPDVITVKTEADVTKVDRELVHVKEYDKGQEELRQELEKQAIEDLKNNPSFYKQGENDVAKQLFDLFSTMYVPAGLEITGVHVKFFDPNQGPKNFTDPEGKTIINFE